MLHVLCPTCIIMLANIEHGFLLCCKHRCAALCSLCCAVLCCTVLCCAVLCGVVLCCAVLFLLNVAMTVSAHVASKSFSHTTYLHALFNGTGVISFNGRFSALSCLLTFCEASDTCIFAGAEGYTGTHAAGSTPPGFLFLSPEGLRPGHNWQRHPQRI